MKRLLSKQMGFFILLTGSMLVGWRALADTLALSLSDYQYTYILLVLPVSAALIFLEWRPLRSRLTLSIRAGSVLLAIAALIACSALALPASTPSDIPLAIRMSALVLWWIGAFTLCFGDRASRLVSFPLIFLFGLVPLPKDTLNEIVSWLQLGSAWSAHLLFAAFGIPITQDGFSITIPGVTLQVAQECSSIRSSSLLLVTTMVLAQLLLRSPWRRALLIGLAIPLSVAKNGLRIFTIAMLGTRVDPGFLTGRLHRQGGILFFVIALIGTIVLLWLLRRAEAMPSGSKLDPVKAAAAGD